MARLPGRAAIVTGAATGIGCAVAWALAQPGAAAIVNYLDTPEKASALVAEIGSNGGSARSVQGDVTRFADFACAGRYLHWLTRPVRAPLQRRVQLEELTGMIGQVAPADFFLPVECKRSGAASACYSDGGLGIPCRVSRATADSERPRTPCG